MSSVKQQQARGTVVLALWRKSHQLLEQKKDHSRRARKKEGVSLSKEGLPESRPKKAEVLPRGQGRPRRSREPLALAEEGGGGAEGDWYGETLGDKAFDAAEFLKKAARALTSIAEEIDEVCCSRSRCPSIIVSAAGRGGPRHEHWYVNMPLPEFFWYMWEDTILVPCKIAWSSIDTNPRIGGISVLKLLPSKRTIWHASCQGLL